VWRAGVQLTAFCAMRGVEEAIAPTNGRQQSLGVVLWAAPAPTCRTPQAPAPQALLLCSCRALQLSSASSHSSVCWDLCCRRVCLLMSSGDIVMEGTAQKKQGEAAVDGAPMIRSAPNPAACSLPFRLLLS